MQYDIFVNVKHVYGNGKLYKGKFNRLAARKIMGYRQIWKINYLNNGRSNFKHSSCVVCNSKNSKLTSPFHYRICALKARQARGIDVSQTLLPENLYPTVGLYPGFEI
uniref:Uncharacterized protein n=1 Tax=Pasiphaea japonica whispovirus TaxID=2984286 RepID=A0A9C7C7H7_9VIRU|nr:MAG: hypothetical protein [Pasiphaea japonica whispovirus]